MNRRSFVATVIGLCVACAAIAGAVFDKPLPTQSCLVGEVGLLGEIRPVSRQIDRLKEAKRLDVRGAHKIKDKEKLRQKIEEKKKLKELTPSIFN